MKGVELYGQVRRAVYVEGVSRREAARRFGIDPRTVAKMLAFSVAARVPAEPAAVAAEAGSVQRDHRADTGGR
jgi:predicted DNA-binding transcriptional regulator YafY